MGRKENGEQGEGCTIMEDERKRAGEKGSTRSFTVGLGQTNLDWGLDSGSWLRFDNLRTRFETGLTEIALLQSMSTESRAKPLLLHFESASECCPAFLSSISPTE